jgi:hypothetical protein
VLVLMAGVLTVDFATGALTVLGVVCDITVSN